MPFDDNDNQNAPLINPGAQPSTPQATPATPYTSAMGPSISAQSPAASQQQGTQPVQPATQQTTANPGSTSSDPNSHPAVQRAGLLRAVAETLAGGPRYTIDQNGNRTPVPLDKKSIGLAIALEALTGSLAGLQAGRGRGPGAAGMAGVQVGLNQVQQKREREQQEFENRSKALARNAAVFETNSRTLLNTSEAEKFGADAIDKLIGINRASGVLDLDGEAVDNSGVPMTQAEMLDAIQNGRLKATDSLGPIAGRVEVANPDGTKRWEATHLILRDGNAPATLTQDDWNRYAEAHVPGFPAGVNIGSGAQVPLRTKQRANEILAAHTLADYRLQDIRDTLAGTALAQRVPMKVDFSQPGVTTAMGRFQRYVSHSNMHGMDVYESLLQMGADKRNPQSGEMEPNPDAKFVDTIAQALGGWPVLKAVHDKLQSNSAGQKSGAEARARGDEELRTAKLMIPIKAETAGAEERARVAANPQNNDVILSRPDALGFIPKVPGGLKEYNRRQNTFKRNADELSKTEGTYQQFQSILNDINAGKDMTGAQSVVGLFNAIGISATPLKGAGFRINNNTIDEHVEARGLGQSLYQKLLGLRAGDVITPQQLKDYADIAMQARQSQYMNLVNQVHNQGLNADFVLPTGNGQQIDPATARIFLQLSGGSKQKAREAAARKGWSF